MLKCPRLFQVQGFVILNLKYYGSIQKISFPDSIISAERQKI